jgi:hypothetical protein
MVINVKAPGDGTAEVPVTLDGTTGDSMYVTSESADGWKRQ